MMPLRVSIAPTKAAHQGTLSWFTTEPIPASFAYWRTLGLSCAPGVSTTPISALARLSHFGSFMDDPDYEKWAADGDGNHDELVPWIFPALAVIALIALAFLL